MKGKIRLSLVLVGLMWAPFAPAKAQSQAPVVPMPQSGVPQIFTMEGKFVRAAYNNEGYVILGYELVNRSIGEEWVLLEVGMTVLDRTPAYKFTRDALSLETPDGKTRDSRFVRRIPAARHGRKSGTLTPMLSSPMWPRMPIIPAT